MCTPPQGSTASPRDPGCVQVLLGAGGQAGGPLAGGHHHAGDALVCAHPHAGSLLPKQNCKVIILKFRFCKVSVEEGWLGWSCPMTGWL
jgi:hypothetical protein